MKGGKALTVVVPAYNSGAFLSKCLDSFCDAHVLPFIEVLVVNDGSRDNTSEIARGYAARWPDSFKVIDKENGGHGSAINLGCQRAAGRYFLVVDSDDWVIAENLPELIRTLSDDDADVILCNYHMVDVETGVRRAFVTKGAAFGEAYTVEQLMALPRDALNCCFFHGIIYRTAFYRQTGLRVSEKVFYEDNEYATIPFFYAETVRPLNLFIYQYQTGSAGQSMSDANRVRNLGQLEKVFWRIADFYTDHRGEMTEGKRAYFAFKLSTLLENYYAATLVKDPDRKRGAQNAAAMRERVKQKIPEIANAAESGYRAARTLHRLGVSSGLLERMKRTKLYGLLRRKL